MLAIGGVLADLAITYLPGRAVARWWLQATSPPTAVQLPGVIAAALATLILGAVLGPEMPLILLGRGLAGLSVRVARRPVPDRARRILIERVEFGKPIGSVSRENGDRAHCSRREAVALTRRRPEAAPHSPARVEGSPVADDALRAGSGRMSGKHTTISSR